MMAASVVTTTTAAPQGAIPDLVYTDPGDGKEKMVEVKFIHQCPSRYRREVATSLRASVNSTREQKLYHEYLTRLRSKEENFFTLLTAR